MRHTLYRPILFCLALCLVPSVLGQSTSCQPSNCVATCQPGCSSSQYCVLGTMTQCGECPASKCVDSSSIGLGGDGSNNGGSDNNGPLIGGLVGGLLGAGLLAACIGFGLYKYRKNRKRSLPIAFQATQSMASMPTPSYRPSVIRARPFSESTAASTPSITSGVIPVAYIPPSQDMHLPHPSQHNTPLNSSALAPAPHRRVSQLNPAAALPSSTSTTPAENPFADPRNSQYSDYSVDDDDDDKSQTNAAAYRPVQFTRARAQIVRVNTVRDLQRGNSVRTITKSDQDAASPTPESNSTSSTTPDAPSTPITTTTSTTGTMASTTAASTPTAVHDAQNPFQDDVYTVDDDNNDDDAPRSTRPVTNHSIASSTQGDGEITIMWGHH
ncbi:hypothetical protein BC940DRAFT_73930 [Gongronella butleri]|nr:hypothetical protein BC940DRAFT_73930 [Gongronella butleri]